MPAPHATAPAKAALIDTLAPPAVRELLQLARAPRLLEPLGAASAELDERVQGIERTLSNLDRSLIIVLLGGTGVGKSTMLNALAAAKVAQTSSVRPCTTATTFYAHRQRDIDRLEAAVETDDARVEGGAPGLEGKVVVDPPDFDSTNPENRLKLLRLLGVADVVLVVANRVKYRQAELFELLARYRASKTFAFVLNGIDDPVYSPSVLHDFREVLGGCGFNESPVFAVSAKLAFESRGAGLPAGPEAGDFVALDDFILRELHERRIREIKTTNLSRSCVELHERLRTLAGAPETWDARLAELEQQRLPVLLERLGEGVARRVRMALFDGSAELELLIEADRTQELEGTFGLFAGMVQRLRMLRRPRAALDLALNRTKPGAKKAAKGDDDAPPAKASTRSTKEAPLRALPRARARPGSLAQAQGFVQRRLEKELRRGIRGPLQQTAEAIEAAVRVARLENAVAAGASEALTGGTPVGDLCERISDTIERELEKHTLRPRDERPIWASFFDRWNIVPNLFLGVGLFHAVSHFFRGQADFGILLFGVLLATAACAWQYRVFGRQLERAKLDLRHAVLEAAAQALRQHLDESALPELRRGLDDARRRVQAIHQPRQPWEFTQA